MNFFVISLLKILDHQKAVLKRTAWSTAADEADDGGSVLE